MAEQSVNGGACAGPGCTDPNAPNYEPAATSDDGSCLGDDVLTCTLTQEDSYGDGWNGAVLTINGVQYPMPYSTT